MKRCWGIDADFGLVLSDNMAVPVVVNTWNFREANLKAWQVNPGTKSLIHILCGYSVNIQQMDSWFCLLIGTIKLSLFVWFNATAGSSKDYWHCPEFYFLFLSIAICHRQQSASLFLKYLILCFKTFRYFFFILRYLKVVETFWTALR